MYRYLTLVIAIACCAPAYGADETFLPQREVPKGPVARVKPIAVTPQPPRPPIELSLASDPNAPFAAYQRGNYVEAKRLAEVRAE